MSKYWPDRSLPEGFSIEKLAKTYRERLSNVVSPMENNPSTDIDDDKSFITSSSVHWANRDFGEYFDAV